MNKETQLRGGLVILSLLLIIISFFYLKQSDELKKCQTDTYSLQGGDISKANLQDSLFLLKTSLDRYEIALELLKDRDSMSASKFENILYGEIE